MIHCIDDHHLLPFVNNQDYNGKGIEVLWEIFAMKSGFLGKTDHEMQQEFTASKILPEESLDNFAL
eukprot:15364439-Ditylum_brightwellii.AAC.3